jgi:outer membrane biosynthesis protein TonB
MIPRTLVPRGARPPADISTTRRRPSSLDERTLVPNTLPIVPLDGHSAIPSNLPLEAIATRVVVPRDINVELVQREDESNLPAQPTDMDERITIPQGVAPPEELPATLPHMSEDLVQPDIIQTGELSFLPETRAQKAPRGEMIVAGASLVLNLLFIIALVQVLTYRSHTHEAEDIGRKQMEVLLPPGALESLKPSEPPAPKPTVKVDPREIRKAAPPIERPAPPPVPQPQPEPPKKELPSAPAPQPSVVQPKPPEPTQGAKGDLPKTPLKLETPDMPVPQSGLSLPKQQSPGDAIRDAAHATKPNAPTPIIGGGPYASGRQGGSGGHGTAGAGIEMLTDTEGVDFNDYLRRVYLTVKQNWFAVMPASVQLGDQGVVSLQFKIMRDGSVPDGDPRRIFGSGKEPLDRAAVSSIRASNPFPQLPGQFKGPYIELRFTYYYNLPIPTQ